MTARTRPAKPARPTDEAVASDPDRADLDRAAAVSRVARRKGTVSAPLAAIRRECIHRVRTGGIALGEIADQIGVTVPRVIQLLADHRARNGEVEHVSPT